MGLFEPPLEVKPMQNDTARWFAALLALSSLACSGEDGPGNTGSAGPAAGAGGSDAIGSPDDEWSTLAKADWTLEPGSEAPDWCVKIPLEEDVYVTAIRPIHPPGTHHTFVVLTDTAEGDGCQTAVVNGTLIYGAGLGTNGLEMPEGVAMKLPAGKVLNLSLHLYNPGDTELTGTSGMEIQTTEAASVKAEAASLLAGPFSLAIPPGRQMVEHECTLTAPTTAFSLFPHMHQLGVHLRTTVVVGGVAKTIHDGPYDFTEQVQFPIEPIAFKAGDKIRTSCTFENPGPDTVTFGESSDTEMCFSFFFRYPASGGSICWADPAP